VIKTWNERCKTHRDHQTGMVSHSMIQARMQEEIDELRAALAQPEQLVVGGDDLPTLTKWTPMAEYAAKSASVPGRAEALNRAGYTRRPRQVPKEDEQEVQKREHIFCDTHCTWRDHHPDCAIAGSLALPDSEGGEV